MGTLLIALGSFVGFIIAYHTYGRWLGRKLFRLDANTQVPSVQINDGVDYVPTRKEVLFGHHFTSIAGTGPIVGPAIAIMWGWLPAVIWVVLGSIFIGAVHDFGALVVSIRNRGQTLGEIAGRLINPRVKVLFLLVLFLCLLIVVAIFGLVLAIIFRMFPASVIPVWLELPLAVGIGWWTYKRGGRLFFPALIVLAIMYLTVWLGVYATGFEPIGKFILSIPIWAWVIILLVYSYIASVLPVTTLLQPRDYINSHQLILAMLLVVAGICVASFAGLNGQPLKLVAPMADFDPPGVAAVPPGVATGPARSAPPVWPFLFITIACGAVSGFHSLVSSGTSSKQLAKEPDALPVGYGSMLTEGALAILVICAVAAGIGMGIDLKVPAAAPAMFQATDGAWYSVARTDEGVQVRNGSEAKIFQAGDEMKVAGGGVLVLAGAKQPTVQLTGRVAWRKHYGGWYAAEGLPAKLGAFVHGAGNFLRSYGIPPAIAAAIMAVLVASFASTTLDTATRLQRYVVTELGEVIHFKPLTTRHGATAFAVVTAGIMALAPDPTSWAKARNSVGIWEALHSTSGTGGLLLWPLFGASNQLLAGLALMVVTFYLLRRGRKVANILIPATIMLIMPAWAMILNVAAEYGKGNWHLVIVGLAILALEAWMVVEALAMWRRARGCPERALPPLALAETPPDYVEANP